jgi:hypothetical protein
VRDDERYGAGFLTRGWHGGQHGSKNNPNEFTVSPRSESALYDGVTPSAFTILERLLLLHEMSATASAKGTNTARDLSRQGLGRRWP